MRNNGGIIMQTKTNDCTTIRIMPDTLISMALNDEAQRPTVEAWFSSRNTLRIVNAFNQSELVAEVKPFGDWHRHPQNITKKYAMQKINPSIFLPAAQLIRYGDMKLYKEEYAVWKNRENNNSTISVATLPFEEMAEAEPKGFEINGHIFAIWNNLDKFSLNAKAPYRPDPSNRRKVTKRGKPTNKTYSYVTIATNGDKAFLKKLAEATARLVGDKNRGISADAYKEAAKYLKTYRPDLLQ